MMSAMRPAALVIFMPAQAEILQRCRTVVAISLMGSLS